MLRRQQYNVALGVLKGKEIEGSVKSRFSMLMNPAKFIACSFWCFTGKIPVLSQRNPMVGLTTICRIPSFRVSALLFLIIRHQDIAGIRGLGFSTSARSRTEAKSTLHFLYDVPRYLRSSSFAVSSMSWITSLGNRMVESQSLDATSSHPLAFVGKRTYELERASELFFRRRLRTHRTVLNGIAAGNHRSCHVCLSFAK